MSQSKMFVLYCSEHGDHYLNQMTEAQLEKKLNDEDWGQDVQFLDPSVPGFRLEQAVGIIIIKGEVVVPKPMRQVTQWKV